MRQFERNPFTKLLHKHPYQACSLCIMDTSDPWITFDAEGVCNHCQKFHVHERSIGDATQREVTLNAIVATLREAGRGRDYDCIMGLSGGVDSSFLAHYAVKVLKLRPLVVHVDSGWNSELAVSNIENICKTLDIDLHTLVIDWTEMQDLQRAFFRAGIANLDVPQDHAFGAALMSEAKKYGIKHILNGGNMQTECTLPAAWGYDASDSVNLLAIHKQYGSLPLKTFPIRSNLFRFLIDPYVLQMRVHRPLEYIDYKKTEAKALLIRELGWRDYGGKHYESKFTKFFQAHYLPEKFGYDKRKAHLSSLVVSGQLSRSEALQESEQPLYDPMELAEDRDYFCKKLGISLAEFNQVMAAKPSFYTDFANSEKLLARLRSALSLSARIVRKFK